MAKRFCDDQMHRADRQTGVGQIDAMCVGRRADRQTGRADDKQPKDSVHVGGSVGIERGCVVDEWVWWGGWEWCGWLVVCVRVGRWKCASCAQPSPTYPPTHRRTLFLSCNTRRHLLPTHQQPRALASTTRHRTLFLPDEPNPAQCNPPPPPAQAVIHSFVGETIPTWSAEPSLLGAAPPVSGAQAMRSGSS